MKRELTPNDILFKIDLGEDGRTSQLKDIPQIADAYRKIKRSISIDKEGYNLYLVDSFSKDKIEELTEYIEEIYKDLDAPRDICYATISDEKKPEVIFIANGKGNFLKKTIEEIKNSYFEVAMEFYNTSSESEKDSLIDEIHAKRSKYIGELVDMAKVEGFEVKATTGGFAFIPLSEEGAMTEKEYDELSEEKKDAIVLKASNLKKKAEIVLERLKNVELGSMKKLKKIYTEFIDVEMEQEKEDCLLEFITDDEAYEYLEKVFHNIERDLVESYTMNVDEDEAQVNNILAKYEIEVLVDNTNNKHPRVIYEEDPSVSNLIGNIEYENHNGLYTTDLSLIVPGSLILANEGCLIIRLNQLIMNASSYYNLKKSLMLGKVNLDLSRNYLDLISVSGLKPEPIPIKTKVILLGDYESYDILYNADSDFKDIFSLKSEFTKSLKISDFKGKSLKEYILERGRKNYLYNISDEAITEIIKYLSRESNDRNKILLEDSVIDKLLVLANDKILQDNRDVISGKDILSIAYEEEIIEKEYLDMYNSKKILLSIEGKKVGAINALAVLSTGYHSFGKPMRVTCVACKGEGRIIDVQKESNLSGNIHEKSINILSGLLSNLISPYEKLPINFHLSFEQTYGKIEGDSASVAEIICILSALSKRGIKQNVAVTGSINQFGEIQPIGGVNEKIEGFYNVCKLLGNIEGKTVLIPETNKDEVILKKEVEESIVEGKFHICTMSSLEDAIEALILEDNERIEDFYNDIRKEMDKYKDLEKKKIDKK